MADDSGDWQDYTPSGAAPSAGSKPNDAGDWQDYTPSQSASTSDSYARAVATGMLSGIPFGKQIGAAAGAAASYIPGYTPELGNPFKADESFGERYQQGKQAIDAQSAIAGQEHPFVQGGAGVGTALAALPVAGPIEGVSNAIYPLAARPTAAAIAAGTAGMLPRAMGTAADALASGAVGSGYGALYGAGEGNAQQGAEYGALGGALIPPVAGAIGKVASAISMPFRGAVDPEAEAAQRLWKTIAPAMANNQGAVSPQDFLANSPRAYPSGTNQPFIVGDLGGEQTRALARAVANRSPEARQSMVETLNDRYVSQPTRFSDYVGDLYGGNLDAQAARDSLAQAAKAVNGPAYQAAYAKGANGVWSEPLQNIVGSTTGQAAIPKAMQFADDYAVANGLPKPKPPFIQDQNGQWQPTQGQYPTLMFWDKMKQAMDSRIGSALSSGDKQTASSIGSVKDLLVNELDRNIPEYAAARAGAFQAFGARDALEAGEKYLGITQGPALDAQNQALQNMSVNDRQMFSRGLARAIQQRALNPSTSTDIVRLFNSPATAQKMQLGLDAPGMPPVSNQIEAYLRRENSMNLLRNAVGANSTSVRQAEESPMAGPGSIMESLKGMGPITGGAFTGALAAREFGLHPAVAIPMGAAYGAFTQLLAKAAGKANEGVMRKLGAQITSDDPATMNAGLKRIASRPDLMMALRRADGAVSYMAGSRLGSQEQQPAQLGAPQ